MYYFRKRTKKLLHKGKLKRRYERLMKNWNEEWKSEMRNW
jgi:hypothetical protein